MLWLERLKSTCAWVGEIEIVQSEKPLQIGQCIVILLGSCPCITCDSSGELSMHHSQNVTTERELTQLSCLGTTSTSANYPRREITMGGLSTEFGYGVAGPVAIWRLAV